MHPRVVFAGQDGSFLEFAEELQSRFVEGASVELLAACPSKPDFERVVIDQGETTDDGGAARIDVEVKLHYQQPATQSSRLRLYNPLWTLDRRIFELSAIDPTQDDCRGVVSYLQQAGFIIIPTRTRGRAGIDRLIRAYFSPLVSYLSNGGRARDANFTLREFGFVRRPHELLVAGIDFIAALFKPGSSPEEFERAVIDALSSLRSAEFEQGAYDQELVDALTISLLAFADDGIREAVFTHPAVIDIAARELIDFPLMHKSLCNYLSTGRVGDALGRSGRLGELLAEGDLATAKQFVERRSKFYL